MRETTTYPAYFTKHDYRKDSQEVTEQKIQALLRALTPMEKFSLVGGTREPKEKGKIGNAGYQWGVPRLGIPEAVMFDGPAGVTGIVETTGLPQPALLGCTWDEEMAYKFGQVAASENAACSGNYQLAPQVDTIHSPHFGRNKDMKSEDSYLVGRLSVAETKGIQDQNVIATLKHLSVANTLPNILNMPNVIVDEQTMHETYLLPFEMCIREGNAGSVMNSYNKVNGEDAAASPKILKDVLRDQWRFGGSLMSDWGSVHEFSLNKGLDLEMPAAAYDNADRIIKHIQKGDCSMEDVDLAVRHVLQGMAEVGLLSLVELDDAGEVKEDLHHPLPIQMEWRYEEEVRNGLFERNQESAREILKEGITLLKNDSALPIKDTRSVALIGLGATVPVTGEMQERSYGRLCRMMSAKEAFESQTGGQAKAYVGIDYLGRTIPAEYLYQDETCTKRGLVRTYGVLESDRNLDVQEKGSGGAGAELMAFTARDEDGERVDIFGPYMGESEQPSGLAGDLGAFAGIDAQIDFNTASRTYKNSENGTAFATGGFYTWSGYLKAPENGFYNMKLSSIGGPARFLIQIDGKWTEIASITTREGTQWPWENVVCTETGMAYTGRTVRLEQGQAYPIRVYCEHTVKNKDMQIRIAWVTPSRQKADYEAALQAAANAETVVFYAVNREDNFGINHYTQTDKIPDIRLVEPQRQLLEDIILAKKADAKLVVVLQTSNAIACGDWADKADAIVTAYMGGQEVTDVMMQVLLGKINPSGKLAQTWPANSVDTPLSDSEAHYRERELGITKDGKTQLQLTEGIFYGYRWYDKMGVKPQFAFGHGLSYTTYEYANYEVKPYKDTFEVSLDVTNTGTVPGDEIVQVYLGKTEVPAYVQMAEKQLAGFARVKNLAAGETRRISILVDAHAFSYWDIAWNLREREDGTKDKWHRATGKREILIGASSKDIRWKTMITVE